MKNRTGLAIRLNMVINEIKLLDDNSFNEVLFEIAKLRGVKMLYSLSDNERDTIIAALIDYIDREKADCDLHDIPYEHIDDLMDAMALYNKLKDIKDME